MKLPNLLISPLPFLALTTILTFLFTNPSEIQALADSLAARYEVKDDTFTTGPDSVHLVVLRALDTNESVGVMTNYGGGVDSIRLRSPQTGEVRPVIWEHGRNATLVRENPFFRGSMLMPWGNRISNHTYHFAGQTFLCRGEGIFKDDPATNSTLHGFLWNQSMSVVSQGANSTHGAFATLRWRVPQGSQIPLIQRCYPFEIIVDITYRLFNSRFSFQVAARNIGKEAAPFQVGWHPYFLIPSGNVASAQLEFGDLSRWGVLQGPTGDVPAMPPVADAIIPHQQDNRSDFGAPESRAPQIVARDWQLPSLANISTGSSSIHTTSSLSSSTSISNSSDTCINVHDNVALIDNAFVRLEWLEKYYDDRVMGGVEKHISPSRSSNTTPGVGRGSPSRSFSSPHSPSPSSLSTTSVRHDDAMMCEAPIYSFIRDPLSNETTVMLSCEDSYPFLQAYTGAAKGCDPSPAVAVEPMSSATDAFNNGVGLQVIAPGTSLVLKPVYVMIQ